MKELNIEAIDGFFLRANLFEVVSNVKGVILLCPGLGIPKEFYFAYCTFLSNQGFVSIVFDYRGIGRNEGSTDHHRVSFINWALCDIPGILSWIKTEFADLKIYFIGHSIAGQIAGLISNHRLIERFFFISSTGGYWREFNFPLNLYTYFLFYIQIPIMVRIFGYMPQSLTYRGVAISKGVALEWAELSRHKDYLRTFLVEKK